MISTAFTSERYSFFTVFEYHSFQKGILSLVFYCIMDFLMVLVLGLAVSFTMCNKTYSEHSAIVGPTF